MWQFKQLSRTIYGSIDRWSDHQAKDVYDVVAAHFGGLPVPGIPSTPSAPIPALPRTGAPYRPGAANAVRNSAMYGKGRLSLFVPERTVTGTSTCVWAEQWATVDPNSPRYEVSWYDFDQYVGGLPDYHLKQVTITNSKGKKLLTSMDVTMDPNMWMNGQGLWGPVDVTQFAKGESKVLLQFALCEANGVGDYMVDVGYDNIETVGLSLVNGDFEQGATGWTIVDPHPGMEAKVVTAP